jgi:hypothetical protein
VQGQRGLLVERANAAATLPPTPYPHPTLHTAPQAQHDYLAGNYPVVREDAAQMAALQMQVCSTQACAAVVVRAAPGLSNL